jgi:hypothetical protein
MAHGVWLEHMNAGPPLLQVDCAAKFVSGLSLASQDMTGLVAKLAFPVQPQEALQQSQYRVVVPVPDACALAWRKNGRRARRTFLVIAMLKGSGAEVRVNDETGAKMTAKLARKTPCLLTKP